jgi:mono/diheme cytochrome c family protein
MAASDQTFRNQKALHLVFAISSIAMLATTVWMFWDDYNRPFKKEQRVFREVEEELAKRAILSAAPNEQQRKAMLDAEKEVAHSRAVLKDVRAQADSEVRSLSVEQVRAEKKFADAKANYDSVTSFYNIEVEHTFPESEPAKQYRKEMEDNRAEMVRFKQDVEKGQTKINETNKKQYKVKVGGDEVSITPDDAEAAVAKAEAEHKKQTEAFDRFLKVAATKQGGLGYTIRQLPVLDAFASPVKIQQYTLDELPIDYSFKFVTRYDRCTTCHLGMEKPTYDRAALSRLTANPHDDSALMADLENARKTIEERNQVIADYNKQVSSKDRKDPLPITAADLEPKSVSRMTDARVAMFAAHPRLDLFVDANSPHPAEKFGCSACHGGQGSATDFVDAVHTPNDPLQRERWRDSNGWRAIHDWDFPMHPQRFAESGCVKCHHQITDLIRDGNKVEAPKLVEGYNLVRELGCFGCHEFAGINKGRWIGPDLRLEPDPPLDAMPASERAKRLSDPLNPPGSMRKVGPNLSRIAEKTNEDWAKQWIKSPRTFRPDTKMPHYYGQPNNEPEALPPEQKKFPDTEVAAITHYLFATSRDEIKLIREHAKDGDDVRKADEEKAEKLNKDLAAGGLTDRQKHDIGVQLADVQARIAARRLALPAEDDIKLPPVPAEDKAKADQIARGRHLFSTRGCLACHQHAATTTDGVEYDGKKVPAIDSDRTFGPELTRLAAKLGTKAGNPATARVWLVRWIMNPSAHNPRTYMPAPFHADDPKSALEQADDIAAWLLSQPIKPEDKSFAPVEAADGETLRALARVWLEKSLTKSELDHVLFEDKTGKGFDKEKLATKPADADERFLEAPLTDEKLMMFVGKKAINNYGCFGCHTIPGFESAKTIGTGLNDWGKKDPDRIAFEDSEHFVEEHFNLVDVRRPLTEEEKKAGKVGWEFGEKGKPPYEKYYSEQLEHSHHTRVGFLQLKLQEPRSYDFNRVRNWDERLRMPQFKFARLKRNAGESDEDYAKRTTKAEAEAREAVMTFVLGLVAEPVPAKYVSTPAGDKAALVKGRQVLDKFNCAGCHVVQPGIYDFKLTAEKVGEKDEEKDGKTVKVPVTMKDAVLTRLDGMFNPANDEYKYPDHNCWAGAPQKDPNKLRAYGLVRPEGLFANEDEDHFAADEKFAVIRLNRALRYTNAAGETRDLRASDADFLMPREALAGHTEQLGGDFANRLARYLQARDQQYADQSGGKSFAAGPPTLTHEGEKVQPVWLYQFFTNPIPLRPIAVLRMPRFNMSTEDAQALVNYFAATSRTTNPGIGVTYPYLNVPERESTYLSAKTAAYDARLQKAGSIDAKAKEMQPIWARITKERIADAENRLKMAKAQLEEARKAVQDLGAPDKQVKSIEAELKSLRAAQDSGDHADLRKEWERQQAYVADAFKLVANDQLCLQCHQVGSIPAKEQLGPSLSLTADRLRPDWLERWLDKPQRFLQYKTIMPANFPADAKNFDTLFLGSEQSFSLDQIKAVRDFLMTYPQMADWPILKERPATGTAGGK